MSPLVGPISDGTDGGHFDPEDLGIPIFSEHCLPSSSLLHAGVGHTTVVPSVALPPLLLPAGAWLLTPAHPIPTW